MTAGRPPSTTTSTSRPSRRSSSATASALRATWLWSKDEAETLGMRTSVLEVGPDLRHEVGDAVADLLDLVGGEGVVSHEPTLPTAGEPCRASRPDG